MEIKEGEGKKGIVVIVEEWEMKRNVMMKKKNLDKGIYIDDDLTRREREIQERLRRMAREEKEKGKEVKIGYKKISVNGKWFKWNEKENCLSEEKEKRRRQQEKEKEERRGDKRVRICFWNIAGVINKDKEVWEYFSGFEMVGLTETWVEEEGWNKIKDKLPKNLEWKCRPAKRENKKGRAKKEIL